MIIRYIELINIVINILLLILIKSKKYIYIFNEIIINFIFS